MAHFLKKAEKLLVMKTLILFLSLILIGKSFGQQTRIGFFVPIDLPVKSSMPKMSTVGGIGFTSSYSPFFHAPVSLELKANIGGYGSRTISQTYQFDDGSQTITDVTYSSGMNKLLIGSKIMVGGDYRAIRGYITPQIGTARFRSRIAIADPADSDACHPLDTDIRQKDRGWIYGGEIGAEIVLSRLLPNRVSDEGHTLFFSASYLRGFDHFEYVNVKYMTDEIHTTMVTHTTADLNAEFINLNTNNIHEHKVAEVYHTPFEMIGLQFGYVYRF